MTDPQLTLVHALIGHDRWANHRVLDRCAELPQEEFHRDFPVGVGGLHAQLVHLVGAVHCWTDVLDRAPVRARPDDLPWSIDRLRTEHDAAFDAYARAVDEEPLGRTVDRTYDGGPVAIPRGTIIAHLATHNAHHRAQCLHILKQLGMAEPLPASVIAWHRDQPGAPNIC